VNSHFVNHEEERFSEPLSPGSIEKKKVEHRVENATFKINSVEARGLLLCRGPHEHTKWHFLRAVSRALVQPRVL